MQSKKCKICKKVFYKPIFRSQIIWDTETKYCSKKCQHASLIGHIPWNKGTAKPKVYKTKEEIRKALSLSHKGIQADEKHPMWKGDKVSYSGLHYWVMGKLGKPTTCEHCGKTGLTGKHIHWANKSHEYKRDLNDWLRLCTSCPKIYDLAFIS